MKYLVICADSNAGVCSVDLFDSEWDARDHLQGDVAATWEDMIKNNGGCEEDDWGIECSAGFGRIDTDDFSYQWSVWPLDI